MGTQAGVRVSWYAVHTKPQKEGLVATFLKWQGFEVLYLHYPAVVKHARRTKTVLRAYFPRYVFAAVGDDQSVFDINNTIGVSTVVYCGDNPLEIPLPVIEELRLRADKHGRLNLSPKETGEQRKRFRRGQKVRITEGILEGLKAIIEVDSGHQVKVWLSLFKGEVPVVLQPEALSPALRSYP